MLGLVYLTMAAASCLACEGADATACAVLERHVREALGEGFFAQAARLTVVGKSEHSYGEVWTVPTAPIGDLLHFHAGLESLGDAWGVKWHAPACAIDPQLCTVAVSKATALDMAGEAGLSAREDQAALIMWPGSEHPSWRIVVPEPLIPGFRVLGESKRRHRVAVVNAHTAEATGPGLELQGAGFCGNITENEVVLTELVELVEQSGWIGTAARVWLGAPR